MKKVWPIFYSEPAAIMWKSLSEIASLHMKLNNGKLLSMIRTLRLSCFVDVIKKPLMSGCVKPTVHVKLKRRREFPPPRPALPAQLSFRVHLQNGGWPPGRHTGQRQCWNQCLALRIRVVTAADTREHCHNLRTASASFGHIARRLEEIERERWIRR